MMQLKCKALDGVAQNMADAKADPFVTIGKESKEIKVGKATLVLTYGGKQDVRRNQDPLQFCPSGSHCFFHGKCLKGFKRIQISENCQVTIDENRGKALLHPIQCGPEPKVRCYQDMAHLNLELEGKPILHVVNLSGSGASVPQHFHTQIMPLEYKQNCKHHKSDLQKLMGNIQVGGNRYSEGSANGLTLKEIEAPLWGVQIMMPKKINASDMGKVLFDLLHTNLRYRSQLALTYNILVDLRNPLQINVFLRESHKERPFSSHELGDILKEKFDPREIQSVMESENSKWRFGYLECLGGLPSRDDCLSSYEADFWELVYNWMSYRKKYRGLAIKAIKEAISAYPGSARRT